MPSREITLPFSRRAALGRRGGAMVVALAGNGQPFVVASDVTTLEANKALAWRVFAEAINQRSTAAAMELIADDYVDSGGAACRMAGPAGMPLTIGEFHRLSTRVYAVLDAAIGEGDLVALRVTWRGNHPPASTHVVGHTMHVFRIAQGQIAAGWSAGWEWLEQLSDGPRRRPGNPLIG